MIYPVTDKPHKKRIIILGGGFGGVYAAIHLEKLLARVDAVEICLISHDNFFLFTPMLHEIAATLIAGSCRAINVTVSPAVTSPSRATAK